MTEVNSWVDISDLLRESLERKNMLLFIDSTMVRVWGDDSDLLLAKSYFDGLNCGRILEPMDLDKANINFNDNRYGDIVFVADTGVVFSPDYFHGDEKLKGMHGYFKGNLDLSAMLIAKGKRIGDTPKPLEIRMIDIFPTILDIFDLKTQFCYEGKSLLENCARRV